MNINVGVGELAINKAPAILETRGLGSCVGVTFYDEKNKIGALAHVMLPSYMNSKETNTSEKVKFKYADYALPYILNKMIFMGSNKKDIVAKIVGGASMFKRKSNILNIGEQNVSAVKEFLSENNLRLKHEEIGGEMGRSIFFDLSNGKILMRIYGLSNGEFEI